MISTSGRRVGAELVERQPPVARVLAQRGDEPAGHPLLLEAQHHDDVHVADRVLEAVATPSRPAPARRAGSAWAARPPSPSCPSLRMAWMLERATRLWAMSPTMATVSPSKWPLCSRIVSRSRSAWVGCSWAPSPALTTPHVELPGEDRGGAGRGVAHHDDVGAHGLDVLGRVDEALALGRAGAAGGEIDRRRRTATCRRSRTRCGSASSSRRRG